MQMIKARGARAARASKRRAPQGEALRAPLGEGRLPPQCAAVLLRRANFGYFYDRSPIIAYDGEAPPPYTMDGFTPSTVPGCRAPHFWLADGRSLYDAFGSGYTLLRFDARIDLGPLAAAAAAHKVPLALVDIDRAATAVPAAYRQALVLCRSDQHIAWRGDLAPAAPERLVDVLRGAAKMDC